MSKPRVLFLCTGNACRSQIGEGWLRHLGGDRVEALSAGIQPHGVNPKAVEVMAEVGVDLGAHSSDDIAGYLEQRVDLVIAVCDSAAEACPTFPKPVPVLLWPFPDPAGATGTQEEILTVFRQARDTIRARIEAWIAEGFPPLSPPI
ncbi:MAG: arsenate reductase [Planctomycetota bacterium]|jgi:arsenate reductase